ncbi:MAG: NnrU family protein [Pigmentiphaga sp.]|nr:NnrU family protein [Pigmentiphaga sp.]
MTVLILGLLLFFGIHSVQIVAPTLRERVIARGGVGAWKWPYTAIAGIGLLLLIIGYDMARHTAPILYYPHAGLRHAALLVMLPVFPLLLATYIKGRIQQWLRHPMLIATILWATAHLMANGSLADLLLFSCFLLWALLDWRSVIVRGKSATPDNRMPWGRNDAIAIIGGLAVYAVFIGGLHALLFGVSPI